jgi:hypothetical protein
VQDYVVSVSPSVAVKRSPARIAATIIDMQRAIWRAINMIRVA